jgi:hypothetical protein
VTVKLELIDSNGKVRYLVVPGEPAWDAMRAALGGPGAPDGDLDLGPEQVAALARALEPAVRELLDHAVAQGLETRPEWFDRPAVVHVPVLDRRLWLNLRHDPHNNLHRFADVVRALEEVSRSGLRLHVYVMPEPSAVPFRVARVLREVSAAVSREQLRELVVRALERLIREEDDKYVTWLRGELDEVTSGTTFDDAVTFLVRWGMATESANGALQATEKLRLVVL